ncbi:Asp23/Gls24 family envelope stress response protein [Feifania hominis]|uniref:Asp23/Gls24 family envelope stress response protein n=1 Tax=Feifania hominis TaxID=2763660 RepID=A0A926HTP3_9FIRM|nr:Asp23/Gls24 family envelope stress response protein [Feifania hominis]MBC8536074.1 Asp23/Gls24 family envelope stress response protein [Feifania hominis]
MIKMENNNGEILISNEVLANIVGHAANECFGVAGMAHKSTADGIVALLKKDGYDKGVKVGATDDKLNIELHIVVTYGTPLQALCDSIIEKVKYQVEEMTGFEVGEITIYVDRMDV